MHDSPQSLTPAGGMKKAMSLNSRPNGTPRLTLAWARTLVGVLTSLLVGSLGLTNEVCLAALESWRATDDREQVLQAIEALDSNRFVAREQATQALIDADLNAIGPLLDALPYANPETRRRGLIVIQRLALSDDPITVSAARKALGHLTTMDQAALANRAQQMLDYANRVREVKTLRQFENFGAVVTRRGMNLNGAYYQVPYAIEIDDRWRGEAADLSKLAWLTEIRQVTLSGQRITDEVIQTLEQLPQLVIVQLKDAEITDRSLDSLAVSKSLIELEIKYCPITDDAIDRMINIKTLQVINLYGTRVSRAGALKLASRLPQAEVDFRVGGFLGVRCTTDNASCLVTFVEPGSAAEQSGIQTGDKIVEFDMNQVASMEKLIELISKADVEQQVDLVYERNEESFRRSVKLGRWN